MRKDIIASDTPSRNLPSQKELERELEQYLSKKYGERIKVVSQMFQPQVETAGKEASPGAEKGSLQQASINFDLKPEELIAYLDEFVVKQDEAKAVLATKICTHFNRIRYGLSHPNHGAFETGRIKNNVLLVGPTGVGKTYLVKLIAEKIGVPFVKGDATKFSETGYVGGDVEDLVRDLVQQADGDIEAAQYGIIYVDEIDKIAGSRNLLGLDVSRTGVQRALLKPMEETEVDMKVPHDPISQIEAIERYRATGKREKRTINTKNVLFIVSGAFWGLEDIIRRRIRTQTMGFEGQISSKKESSDLMRHVRSEDLINFGFESEFIGRLPVTAVCEELTEEDLYQILRSPNSGVVVGKKQDFRAYGIRILFEDAALRELAKMAQQEHTGARGLVSVVEKTLLPFEKKLPSTDVRYLVITPQVVYNPRQELETLIAEPDHEALARRYEALLQDEHRRLVDFFADKCTAYLASHGVALTPTRLDIMASRCLETNSGTRSVSEHFVELIGAIRDGAARISERCALDVTFGEDAMDQILLKNPASADEAGNICEELGRTFEYGFRLIGQKKGKRSVKIPAQGVESPEQYINALVSEIFQG